MTKYEAIETLSDIRGEYNCFEPTERLRYRALSMGIKALKTELIHCKDCEWWNESYRECESPNWDIGTDRYITTPAGGYCMWAGRRTE